MDDEYQQHREPRQAEPPPSAMPGGEIATGERLRAFIASLGEKPVEWGVDDCSAWPAQWVVELTHKELLFPFYDDPASAQVLIDGKGGLAALWDSVLRPAGIYQLVGEEPVCGDVGVIRTRSQGDVGGIFAHGRIFCWRAEIGVRLLTPRIHTIAAMWRVLPAEQ